METKHILSSFDDDLNKLNNSLLKLGNGALDQFEKCINNFGTQNLEDIEKVVRADKVLDDLDDKVQKYGFWLVNFRMLLYLQGRSMVRNGSFVDCNKAREIIEVKLQIMI